MFRYNQNSWTNLSNESPAREHDPGSFGRRIPDSEALVENVRCFGNSGADEGWGHPGAEGAGRLPLGAGWLRVFECRWFPMHLESDKPRLRSQAGATFLMFVPKQGTQAKRCGRERGAGFNVSLRVWAFWWRSRVSLPSRTSPLAPSAPNFTFTAWEDAEFRKLFQKNKSPTSTLLV